ncbi:MAG: TonB-dependent receptor domain-containing protein, partial [Gemmatimonadaceae bacterium]
MISRADWQAVAVSAVFLLLLAPVQGTLRAQGTVTGRVISESSQPLAGAQVIAVGATASATTSEDGRYTLRNVRPGAIDVQVLHVGFKSEKQRVTVPSGSSVEANFRLARAVIQLTEVVTTATGQQRRSEIGNAISTLGDVSKRVEETPVTDITGLMTAKSPGVIILPSPVLGGAPTPRIRGISSISLSNEPIWVVDGVRYITNATSSAGANAASLLNNLSPEEIQDIEIVKGPSAATLYGTNAANGVIVVTTKKGRAGSTRWNVTAESRTVDDRNHYQPQYANWGHSPTNPTKAIRCQLYVMATPSFTPAQGATCISDSLTTYDVLGDPENTIIQLGRGSLYGVSANGGSETVRFFVSGNLDNEFGPIQMPAQDIAYYENVLHVPVTGQMFHPRQQQKMNFRTNVSAALSPTFDLTANAGFGKSSNTVEPDNSSIIGLLYVQQSSFGYKGCPAGTENSFCGLDKSWTDPTGFPLHDANSFAPGSIMQYITTDDVQRFTGSLQANWRPLSWMQNDGTVGVDLSNNDQFHVCKLNECPNQGGNSRVGNVYDLKQNRRNFSAKLASTGTWQVRPWANLKTSVGSEYTNVEFDSLWAQARFLPPGASTLQAASTIVSYAAAQPNAVKTLGYYVQEQLALRDRLFLTVAARQDQNSAFGTDFQKILYPKVSLSWIASDEDYFPKLSWLNSFRLRSAYGANGVQPGATAALQTFTPTTVNVATKDLTTGPDLPGLTANTPGNAALKPETSSELEAGFETELVNHRLRLDYTYYRKKTTDALINVPIPSSVGAPVTNLLQNVGSTQNVGHELQANAVLVDLPSVAWDVTVSASRNDNKWLDLGTDPGTGLDRVIGAGTVTQQRKGGPLFGQWYRNYTFADANGDGIIQQSEVQVDTALSFQGVGFATKLISIQNGIDLFRGKLRINALFDYRGGGKTLEGNYFQCSSAPKACRETQDPTQPLWLQARAVAVTYGTKVNGTTYTSRVG